MDTKEIIAVVFGTIISLSIGALYSWGKGLSKKVNDHDVLIGLNSKDDEGVKQHLEKLSLSIDRMDIKLNSIIVALAKKNIDVK